MYLCVCLFSVYFILFYVYFCVFCVFMCVFPAERVCARARVCACVCVFVSVSVRVSGGFVSVCVGVGGYKGWGYWGTGWVLHLRAWVLMLVVFRASDYVWTYMPFYIYVHMYSNSFSSSTNTFRTCGLGRGEAFKIRWYRIGHAEGRSSPCLSIFRTVFWDGATVIFCGKDVPSPCHPRVNVMFMFIRRVPSPICSPPSQKENPHKY